MLKSQGFVLFLASPATWPHSTGKNHLQTSQPLDSIGLQGTLSGR